MTNDDGLIEKIIEEFDERSRLEKSGKPTAILNGIFFKLGITNNMCVCDRRTLDIMKKYEMYKNAPYLIDNSIWFEAVQILNKLQPRLC